jgi:pilus assembly protein CpaF
MEAALGLPFGRMSIPVSDEPVPLVLPFVPPVVPVATPIGSIRPRHARDAPLGLRTLERLIDFEELIPLIVDPGVTDVLVLGGVGVWSDRGDGITPATGMVLREPRARELATRLVAAGGRHVDESTPTADVDLGDGVRVHVVLPPLSVRGTSLSIRLPKPERLTLQDLECRGFFGPGGLDLVAGAVGRRTNVLISGATGSGKTTLLGAMLALVPDDERIVTVEDVAELRIDHPHVVGLQTRQANAEGAGAVGLDRLVRESLRMRPDRIVVGECRGAEVRELMSALNTGHRGGAGTVHANGVEDVPARLEALGALAGLDADALARQAVSAFDLVLHVGRRAGRRSLEAAARLTLDGRDRLAASDVRAL